MDLNCNNYSTSNNAPIITPIPDFQTFCDFPASFFTSLSTQLWPISDQSDNSQCSSSDERSKSGRPPKRRMEANARERDRTMSVNSAFKILRTLIPTEPPNRKLSKIETLRLATSYINHLSNVRKAVSIGDSPENACSRSACVQEWMARNEGRPYRSSVCTFCITSGKRRH